MQIIRNREEIIVFCQIFITIILLYIVFHLLNIEIIILLAFQNVEKHNIMINFFNNTIDKSIIFLIIYVVGATSFNLQKNCHRVYLIEKITNLEILNQVLRRYKRLNNLNSIIYIYKYYVDGIFDNKNI